MSVVHQMYCTHCTHGTSALDRREGELAHRMLGYSARAGSLTGSALRSVYRQIERYVYYYLPRDTPAEEKLRLTAASAPRRLIYLPSVGGLQVVAQVCYRQRDTEGRPGSYFAHVLFRQEQDGGPRWSPLDALKLWRAPGWAEEDRPDYPFVLAPVSRLDELLQGAPPAINDELLYRFLTAPAGGSWGDAGGVIPARWVQAEPAARQTLFAQLFRGFWDTGGDGRRTLLVVVEPGLAALLFYGLLRLLPPGAARDTVSFSTFEPNTDRPSTAWAGTVFYNPIQSDLRPEAYRGPGFVMNTFSRRRSEGRQGGTQYPQQIIDTLLREGWEAVDRRLAHLQAVGAHRVADVEAMAAVERLAAEMFRPGGRVSPGPWRRSPMAVAYLRRRAAQRLAYLQDPAAVLRPLVGSPSHLLILELLAGESIDPAVVAAVNYLLEHLPGDAIHSLLRLASVGRHAKVDVLVRYVTRNGQLPPACEWLWDEAVRFPAAGQGGPLPLLPELLVRLEPAALENFYQHAAARHGAEFLAALTAAAGHSRTATERLTWTVRMADAETLLAVYQRLGPAWLANYPQGEPALGRKLHDILYKLPEQPRRFSAYLDLIQAGQRLLPESRDLELLRAWCDCRETILQLGRLQERRSGVLRTPPAEEMETVCRRMAEAAERGFAGMPMLEDATGRYRQQCLAQIGRAVLGNRPLMPRGVKHFDALWQKVEWHFRDGRWPRAELKRMVRRRIKYPAILLCAVALLVGLGLVYAAWQVIRPHGPPGPAPVSASSKPAARSAKQDARQGSGRRQASSSPRQAHRSGRAQVKQTPPGGATEPPRSRSAAKQELPPASDSERTAPAPAGRPAHPRGSPAAAPGQSQLPEEPKQPAPPRPDERPAAAPAPAEAKPPETEPSGPAAAPSPEGRTAIRTEKAEKERGALQPAQAPQATTSSEQSEEETLPVVEGRFSSETERADGLRPTVMAIIAPRITGENKQPLPRWYNREIVTGWVISMVSNDGRASQRRLDDVRNIKGCPLPLGTRSVRCRFTFAARPRTDGLVGEPTPVAQSGWFELERVESGRRYVVQLELTEESLGKLRSFTARN